MAKDKEPNSGSVARAKRIHEQVDQLRKKRSESAPTSGEPSPAGAQPRSLRDIIHDRMEKLDKKKGS